MRTEEGIKLIGICSHCGESTAIVLPKSELKILWKSMRLPFAEREKWTEQQLQKIRRNRK